MKTDRSRLASVVLAVAAWAGVLMARGELTPVFTLDTLTEENGLSALFALDTRDPDVGSVSALFTLDTRGALAPQSALFTLDTRDLDRFYAPENLALAAEQPTTARATWDCFGTPLGFVLARREPQGEWGTLLLTNGTLRAWTDTTVLPGLFYEYRVAATWPDGMSDYSEVACIQMPSLPAAPASPCASLTEAGSVAISWQDASFNEDGSKFGAGTERPAIGACSRRRRPTPKASSTAPWRRARSMPTRSAPSTPGAIPASVRNPAWRRRTTKAAAASCCAWKPRISPSTARGGAPTPRIPRTAGRCWPGRFPPGSAVRRAMPTRSGWCWASGTRRAPPSARPWNWRASIACRVAPAWRCRRLFRRRFARRNPAPTGCGWKWSWPRATPWRRSRPNATARNRRCANGCSTWPSVRPFRPRGCACWKAPAFRAARWRCRWRWSPRAANYAWRSRSDTGAASFAPASRPAPTHRRFWRRRCRTRTARWA